jgi:hypothetical protein
MPRAAAAAAVAAVAAAAHCACAAALPEPEQQRPPAAAEHGGAAEQLDEAASGLRRERTQLRQQRQKQWKGYLKRLPNAAAAAAAAGSDQPGGTAAAEPDGAHGRTPAEQAAAEHVAKLRRQKKQQKQLQKQKQKKQPAGLPAAERCAFPIKHRTCSRPHVPGSRFCLAHRQPVEGAQPPQPDRPRIPTGEDIPQRLDPHAPPTGGRLPMTFRGMYVCCPGVPSALTQTLCLPGISAPASVAHEMPLGVVWRRRPRSAPLPPPWRAPGSANRTTTSSKE